MLRSQRLGRRFAAVGLAVVLAAGPLATLSTEPASAAAKPGYVAIVVDGHGSYCVKWKAGITGDTVLNAVATVHYRQPDGLIDAIDNYPSPPHADGTHYWSYWHDTSGSWSYSQSGASATTPAAGTVEGWTFDNGHAPPGPKPSENPSGLYATLCGPHDSSAGDSSGGGGSGGGGGTSRQSTPAARVSAKHTSGTSEHLYHPRTGSASTTSANTSATSSAAKTSTTVSPSSSTSARPSTSGPASATTSHPAPSEPVVITGSSSAAGAPIAGVDATPAVASSQTSGSSGSLTSVLVGIGLVVLLGGGAALVVLRRRAANAGF